MHTSPCTVSPWPFSWKSLFPVKTLEKIHYLLSKGYCGLTLAYQFVDRFDCNAKKINVSAKTTF